MTANAKDELRPPGLGCIKRKTRLERKWDEIPSSAEEVGVTGNN